MQGLLEQLSRRQLIWQGSAVRQNTAGWPSGYPEFDQALGGWPSQGLIALQSLPAIGELRLVLPLLGLLQQRGLLCLINPPQQLHAEPLLAAGLQLHKILLLSQLTEADGLWAAEQVLRSGLFKAVLLWQPCLSQVAGRRLQLAAEQQQALLIQFSTKTPTLSLPLALALSLSPTAQGLQLRVLKRRASWAGLEFTLNMQAAWPALYPHQSKVPHTLAAAG